MMKMSKLKVLAINASSRSKSNTYNLLQMFLKRFNLENEELTYIDLNKLDFTGCQSCYGCAKLPKCVVKDDLTDIFPIIEDADIIVFATPVYFNSVSFLAKAFIDRMQVYWSRKFILKLEPLKKKFGVALIDGGSSIEEEQFLGSELVFDHFFKVTSCVNHLFLEISETDRYPINSSNEQVKDLLNSIELNFNNREKYRLKGGKVEKWN